jgi:hypothetical protein
MATAVAHPRVGLRRVLRQDVDPDVTDGFAPEGNGDEEVALALAEVVGMSVRG